jgi:hypothetical protein
MANFIPPQLPTIPLPGRDIPSMHAALMAIKQTLDVLTGQSDVHMPARVYMQDTPPVALHTGDMWIKPYPSLMMSYWDGQQWQVIVGGSGGGPSAGIAAPALFGARMSAAQAILAAPRNPNFDAAVDNLGGYFNAATGLFAPPPGYYQLNASVGTVTTGNNAELYVAIYKDATEIARGASSASQGGIAISANTTISGSTAAGDNFSTRIWSDRTGQITDGVSCLFSGVGRLT